MLVRNHRWVIVLAAGEGARLQALTGDGSGIPIPKQYCALRGSRSMLRQTLERAKRLVPPERIVVVVAAQHERWWRSELVDVPEGNVVVQPQNRGTAAGLLLPLLRVHANDAEAEIVVLPSDHFVERSDLLYEALESGLIEIAAHPERVVLLGVTPESAETDYGWILPDRRSSNGILKAVETFLEKPKSAVAVRAMADGGLINAFIVIARSSELLKLYEQVPSLLELFQPLRKASSRALWQQDALEQLYGTVPSLDFSRDLLEIATDRLWVLRLPPCGWTDLGTPERVQSCLRTARGIGRGRESGPVAALDLYETLRVVDQGLSERNEEARDRRMAGDQCSPPQGRFVKSA